jgi:drug/metabolite transporter (DMT)-like permease
MSRSVVPPRVVTLLVLAAASWGAGTVISKRAVAEIPPLVLLVVQLATSVAALWVVMLAARGRGATADPDRRRGQVAIDRLGLLNPGAAYALGLIGLSQTSASLSVLLWAVEPVLILVLAWRWLGERVTSRLAALSVAAAGGMVLVVWAPGVGGGAFGIAVTLAGVGCCAVYSVLTRRRLGDAPSTLRVVLGQQAWALGLAIALLPAALVLDPGGVLTGAVPGRILDPGVVGAISTGAWFSAITSGIVYYALAYAFYLAALRHVAASLAAPAFYLIPVFGVAGGWAFLGERLEPAQWLGAAIVLACVVAIARTVPNQVGGTEAAATTPGPLRRPR